MDNSHTLSLVLILTLILVLIQALTLTADWPAWPVWPEQRPDPIKISHFRDETSGKAPPPRRLRLPDGPLLEGCGRVSLR